MDPFNEGDIYAKNIEKATKEAKKILSDAGVDVSVIIVSWYEDGATKTIRECYGNHYARTQLCREFVIYEDEKVKEMARNFQKNGESEDGN